MVCASDVLDFVFNYKLSYYWFKVLLRPKIPIAIQLTMGDKIPSGT